LRCGTIGPNRGKGIESQLKESRLKEAILINLEITKTCA